MTEPLSDSPSEISQSLVAAAVSSTPQPAPATETPTPRDMQRAALRDLVSLATECATTEADIERRKTTALDDAAKLAIRGKWEADQRLHLAKGAVEQKHAERLNRVETRFQSELNSAKAAERTARERVANQVDPQQREIREKYEQNVWLADSVFEATEDQVREDINKTREDNSRQLQTLDAAEEHALSLMHFYGHAPFDVPDCHTSPQAATPAGPSQVGAAQPARLSLEEAVEAFKTATQTLARSLDNLRELSLPRLFVGARPYIALFIVCVLAAVATQLATGTLKPQYQPLSIAVGVTFAIFFGAGFVLNIMAKTRVRAAFVPIRQASYDARRAAKAQFEAGIRAQEEKLAAAAQTRKGELAAAKQRFTPMLDKVKATRDAALAAAAAQTAQTVTRIEAQRKAALGDVERWLRQRQEEYAQRHERELKASADRNLDQLKEIELKYQEARDALEKRLRDGLTHIQKPMAESEGTTVLEAIPRDWNQEHWKNWKPSTKFAALVPFGELQVDLRKIADSVPHHGPVHLQLPATFSMPALLAFPRQASLLVQTGRSGRDEALRVLQMLMARLLTSLPPGRVRFHIIDPVGLGQNFAGFMHLADYDEALVGVRILTDAEHIEKRLADLTEHMETVIQKYLRNEFATIDEYNAQAGELAEPYRFLVIADFPVGFQGDAFRRLSSIVTSGARCGVYVLIARDIRQQAPHDSHMDDLEAHSVNLVQDEQGRLVWKDDVFEQFPLAIDPPPGEEVLTELLHIVGQGAKDSKRIELPFDIIVPRPDQFWRGSTSSDVVVPVGRTGATRLQTMRLGRGVAQHVLIAGKTGSGKSTLLNALITNLAMWYSPDEIEFYLIDFKKGVEFKAYATSALPHARAIAVESDREFGISVLQQLDAELTRRGVLYRNFGVQDLANYRAAAGTDAQPMPRTLLIIDEFQEFFSEDDKIAQEAALLLDRLVRQGRAFGMHVILGSQTIGGSSGLPRATIGQMAVRVALQCSEADSQLILGDNNSAARLLTRPGEAIYNDAGGLVEGNSPFQVAWLSDEQRETYLGRVHDYAQTHIPRLPQASEPPIVFEGNAHADINKNVLLATAIDAPSWPNASTVPMAWLGDPVAIKDPTAIAIRRQAGANILMLGQQEESAMAMMAAILVSLAAQHAPGSAVFYLLDGSPADSPMAQVFPQLQKVLPQDIKLVEFRALAETITALAAELANRQANGPEKAPSIYVLIYGLQRYRVLRKSGDEFGFSMGSDAAEKPIAVDKQFGDLIKEGPSLGIHLITWADTMVSIDRTLDRNALREFDNRVLFQMSANDSSNLIDSPAGNKLGFFRALLYSEEQGLMEKFRPYAQPSAQWVENLKARLARKATAPSA